MYIGKFQRWVSSQYLLFRKKGCLIIIIDVRKILIKIYEQESNMLMILRYIAQLGYIDYIDEGW